MRRILFALLILAVAWGGGLFMFLSEIPAPAETPPAPADGVVVFTGGFDRVSSAMALLNAGAGKRLLISGVNPRVSRTDVFEMWSGDPSLFECCVDLGQEARTTRGNADELDSWTRRNAYRSLILVTSDFHMPRALLETRQRMPDVVVTPYPVASGLLGENGKPRSLSDWRRISGEYTKYIAVRAKSCFT
ncbi:MAG: YdcF family protein [Parvularculaceae bacterium]|nr:YdcF family protein [Parvularculaceae bacterium]